MDHERSAGRDRCPRQRPIASIPPMSDAPVPPDRWRAADVAALFARLLLAGLFLYMGLTKALHPVEFLKLVRQYEVLHAPFALNLVAAALPWFEIFCALLLLAGVAVRGAA